MASLANVTRTATQPTSCASDPLAEVPLMRPEILQAICCSTTQSEGQTTPAVDGNASSAATLHRPTISVSLIGGKPWRDISHPFFRNHTTASSRAGWASRTSLGANTALRNVMTSTSFSPAPTMNQTPTANATLFTGTGAPARGDALSVFLAGIVLLSFIFFL